MPTRRTPRTSPVLPFPDAFAYLEAWFEALGPAWPADPLPPALARVPSIDDRRDRIAWLLARTEETLEAGVPLPFETFVRASGLDLLDRLLLLALLRHALDPQAARGIKVVLLLHAAGADTLERRHEVLSRLETAGRLRDLALIDAAPDVVIGERGYRLPPRLVEPLWTGGGDPDGLPALPADPLQLLELLLDDVVMLAKALEMRYPETETVWNGPAPGRPGWDHTALRRRKLAARLEAMARAAREPIGAEIARLGLAGDERLVWAGLVKDATDDVPGLPVPWLLRFSGSHDDPAEAAERIFGRRSKLAGDGALRFNRRDGPLMAKAAWLSQEARGRVIPWPRHAFRVREGSDTETALEPRVGFDAAGVAKEDRAARAGGTP